MNIEEINNMFKEQKGFIAHNNITIEEVKDNYAKLSANIDNTSLNPYGIIHGGLLFGLADTAMGIAARTTGKNAVTVNSQIDYLKAGKGKKITAISEAVKVGKTISVYKCNIYNEEDELITTVTGTFYFIPNQ